MVYNSKHVRIAEDGKLEGITDKEVSARVLPNHIYNGNPDLPLKYAVYGASFDEKPAEAGKLNGVSTDKRSEVERKISQLVKARENKAEEYWDELSEVDDEEEVMTLADSEAPAEEQNDKYEIREKNGRIEVYEKGKLVAEAYDPCYVSEEEQNKRDIEMYTDYDQKYLDWYLGR